MAVVFDGQKIPMCYGSEHVSRDMLCILYRVAAAVGREPNNHNTSSAEVIS